MKLLVDKQWSKWSFELGDWVFLKLQPHKQTSLQCHQCHKLSQRYYGLFTVIEKKGLVTFKLALPASSWIHPVFPVLPLKKVVGSLPIDHVLLPDEVQPLPAQPVAILNRKMVKHDNRAAAKVLIQCSDLPLVEATWEFLYDVQCQFPTMNFEDKIFLWREYCCAPRTTMTWLESQ